VGDYGAVQTIGHYVLKCYSFIAIIKRELSVVVVFFSFQLSPLSDENFTEGVLGFVAIKPQRKSCLQAHLHLLYVS